MDARRTSRLTTYLRTITFMAAFASGCASTEWVKVRETPRNPLAGPLALVSRSGPKPTERTLQIVRRFGLENSLDGDHIRLLTELAEYNEQDPNRETLYAIAELAYVAAERTNKADGEKALELYGTSVVHAYGFLFDEAYAVDSNPYDPQFRRACDLYNASLESVLRLIQKQGEVRPGETIMVRTAHRNCELTIELISDGWRTDDFDRFEFVSDYKVKGLRNHYHNFGLGVPLIAMRKQHESKSPVEQFYPPQLTFPVTAVLRVAPTTHEPWPARSPTSANPDDASTRTALKATLELHDPLTSDSIQVANKRAPLETDLSTPLAYFLSQPEFDDSQLSTIGLLKPDSVEKITGLYMLEPFQKDKMPVVMVHGLWSSPVTWMEMFNDLRSDPRIRENYQFWFYLYPSGQPFWYSAAQMREDLAEARAVCDPGRQFHAMDQMVLVGHSMGGLVSKLQSVDSGAAFWETVSEEEFAALKANEDVRDALAKTFFFKPNPSIRRVVTIGTPHRGSRVANDVTRWLGRTAINLPTRLLKGQQQIVAQNPGYFRKNSSVSISTSIDSLSPDSTFFQPLLTAEYGAWTHHHNIVGRVSDDGLLGAITSAFGSEGDGVVSLASAELDDADSQIIVPADHTSIHRHPRSVLEVRRILLEQLAELKSFPKFRRTAAVTPNSDSTTPVEK